MTRNKLLCRAALCAAASLIAVSRPGAAQETPAQPAAQAQGTGQSSGTTAAQPGQKQEISWREVVRITENQAKRTDTVPPKALGLVEEQGLVFFSGGDVGAVTLWFTWEGDSNQAHYRGYGRYDFADASNIYTSFEGSGPMPGKQVGTIEFLGGTGRFEGISGTGQFGAATLTSASNGGDTFRDVRANITLPAKPAKKDEGKEDSSQ